MRPKYALSAVLAGGVWWWHELQVTISTDNAQVTGNIAYISPKISGRLTKIYVTESNTVTQGQKLAELDHRMPALALKQAASSRMNRPEVT